MYVYSSSHKNVNVELHLCTFGRDIVCLNGHYGFHIPLPANFDLLSFTNHKTHSTITNTKRKRKHKSQFTNYKSRIQSRVQNTSTKHNHEHRTQSRIQNTIKNYSIIIILILHLILGKFLHYEKFK